MRGRRNKKSKSKERAQQQQRQRGSTPRVSDTGAYTPPSMEGAAVVADPDSNLGMEGGSPLASFPPPDYVTQPPRQRQGLTGKISTLFRQKSNTSLSTADNNTTSRHGRAITSARSTAAASTATSVTSSPRQQSQQQRQRSAATSTAMYSRSGSVDTDDVLSVGSRTSQGSRIFYSSHQDDDSDDSYESRVSRESRGRRSRDGTVDNSTAIVSGATSGATTRTSEDDMGGSYSTAGDTEAISTVVRFRGFSTSIRSLFLDEALVCASMGCFGLILSNRTEYLLDLRAQRRGLLASTPRSRQDNAKQLQQSRRFPSRIISYGLFLTVTLMFVTFLVYGFGGGGLAEDYMTGYDNYNSNNNNGDDAAAYYDDDQQQVAWDDYLQNNNQNYYNGKGNYYANDDAANDDQYNNDDAANDDQYNNDDANNYYNDDGGNGGDDDGNNNNYYYNDDANGDDNYGGRLLHQEQPHVLGAKSRSPTTRTQGPFAHHPLHGICKLRDWQEYVWDPVVDALSAEWQREVQQEERRNRRRRRAEEEAYYQDDGGYYGNNDNSNTDGTNNTNNSNNTPGRDTGSVIRLSLFVAFVLFLGVVGRRRRMRTRFNLVRARAQEDHLYYASSDRAARRRVAFDNAREDQYEGACSHTLCGCYPVDDVDEHDGDQQVEVTDSGIFRRKKRPHHEDIVARCFNCVMASCCGVLCKCWFQCLSVCALAQEAREIRLLLPPRYQRIDFITHQPFHEYQKSVNNLRRAWLGKAKRVTGIMPHYDALSILSRYIVVLFTISLVAIVSTLVFNPRATFSWQDAVVLLATFLHSFLVLFFVHGIFHKSDLSLDAVIKMFAAGFVIAVPAAFFFEGLVVNLSLLASWSIYFLCELCAGDLFSSFVYDHWRIIWFVGELFNAYIVAAVTEEICKYYTFRTVEHPDLVFLTGLQREEQDETAVDGGLVSYPFASHQVQEFIRDDDSRDGGSPRSRSRSRGRTRRTSDKSQGFIETTGTTDTEFDEDETDIRTYRQKAMAITTGMISVAVGLGCAENFLYVFVLGGAVGGGDGGSDQDRGDDILQEWMVLFFRSIFPVHALSAAIQSINMIRKFVESSDDDGHRIGVGRIVLPAIILHGSFDAVLMGINVYMETAWDKYYEENGGAVSDDEQPPYNAFIVNAVAWTSIWLIMIGGMIWYYRENRKQSKRLKVLEEREEELDEMQREEMWVSSKSQSTATSSVFV